MKGNETEFDPVLSKKKKNLKTTKSTMFFTKFYLFWEVDCRQQSEWFSNFPGTKKPAFFSFVFTYVLMWSRKRIWHFQNVPQGLAVFFPGNVSSPEGK